MLLETYGLSSVTVVRPCHNIAVRPCHNIAVGPWHNIAVGPCTTLFGLPLFRCRTLILAGYLFSRVAHVQEEHETLSLLNDLSGFPEVLHGARDAHPVGPDEEAQIFMS